LWRKAEPAAEAQAKLKEEAAQTEKRMVENPEILTGAVITQNEIERRAETLFLEFRVKQALRMKAKVQAMADAITQALSDLQGSFSSPICAGKLFTQCETWTPPRSVSSKHSFAQTT
jgi:hypothetical protein